MAEKLPVVIRKCVKDGEGRKAVELDVFRLSSGGLYPDTIDQVPTDGDSV